MTRGFRIRPHRGQVVVTGGGTPIAMTADEARAFARALLVEADSADPIQRDRVFGEKHTPYVPPAPVPDIRPGAINLVDPGGAICPRPSVQDFLDDAGKAIAELNAVALREHYRRLQAYGVSTYKTDQAGRINLVDVDR